jgi:hypothetical protein
MEESEQPAQFPEADGGGGRSGRGPATHVPGKTEPGGVVPPYEGRKEAAEIDGEGERGPKTNEGGLTSPRPEDTPGGRTASPADEQPAAESPETEPSDPGVGPAHTAGTPRGEDLAEGEPHHVKTDDDDPGAAGSERPAGTSKPEDWTGISPSAPKTDTPFEQGDTDSQDAAEAARGSEKP